MSGAHSDNRRWRWNVTAAGDHGLFAVHDTGQTATDRDASADCSIDSSRRRRPSRSLSAACNGADSACTVAGSTSARRIDSAMSSHPLVCRPGLAAVQGPVFTPDGPQFWIDPGDPQSPGYPAGQGVMDPADP